MQENRSLIVGLVIVVIAILAGVWFIKTKKAANPLPDGKITTLMNPSPSPLDMEKMLSIRPQVVIATSKGNITLELRPDVAPKTVSNFLLKFNTGYCDNLTWHRVEDWVVQGCDPLGTGTGGESNLPTEFSQENFGVGALGVARKATPREVSNDSQFFITKKDSSFLNGDYTYFGKVVSGMDVVNKLAAGDKILSTTILGK